MTACSHRKVLQIRCSKRSLLRPYWYPDATGPTRVLGRPGVIPPLATMHVSHHDVHQVSGHIRHHDTSGITTHQASGRIRRQDTSGITTHQASGHIRHHDTSGGRTHQASRHIRHHKTTVVNLVDVPAWHSCLIWLASWSPEQFLLHSLLSNVVLQLLSRH